MKKNTLYIAFMVLLFCGNAVLYTLWGWAIDFYGAPTYQKVRPEFYLLVLYMCITHCGWSKIHMEEKAIILLTGITFLYWIITAQSNGFAVLVNAILLPTFISIILLRINSNDRHKIFNIIIIFYLLNSSLALLERFMGNTLFPYYSGGNLADDAIGFVDNSTFRSSALRNHPLGNALLTTCIMGFILVNNQIKKQWRLLLYLVGFVALMCFNARSSMMISGIILFIYIFYNIFINNISEISRIKLCLLSIIIIVVVCYLFQLGYGGRLLEKDNLNDTSVEARLLLFETFYNLDISVYFFGMSNEKIYSTIGLLHIENFWILFLLRMGIPIFIAYIIFFYKLFRRWLKGYHWITVAIPLGMFFLVASTNNSLYSGDPGIALFLMCSATMLPNKLK